MAEGGVAQGFRSDLSPVLGAVADLETLAVGQVATFSKTIEMTDIVAFAEASGDTNPVHLDAEAAAQSQFGRPIAHGMLTASLISAVLGTRLPGSGCIYLSQTLTFKAPVWPGDEVTARAEIVAIDTDRRRVTAATMCLVGDRVVLEGEAKLMIPRPAG